MRWPPFRCSSWRAPEDRTIPPDSAPRLARQIGERARLVLVDGAGHMVNVTHAAAVDAALDDLLSRSRPARPAR